LSYEIYVLCDELNIEKTLIVRFTSFRSPEPLIFMTKLFKISLVVIIHWKFAEITIVNLLVFYEISRNLFACNYSQEKYENQEHFYVFRIQKNFKIRIKLLLI